MAIKETLAYDITVNNEAATASVGSFKKQLREANTELLNMASQFGDASNEALNAAKKVAKLKDSIGDAKALADTFNPDKKFVALGGALQGATAGFSALQGAMGLFGSEGKEVEKALLKVQSAMALQQGISGIAGAMDSFKMLGNEIKGNLVKAFSTLKGAIAATGIGLLVVGIGLLVANFDKVKAAIERMIGPLKNVTDFFGKMIDAVTDFVGVTSEAERALDKLGAATKRQNETIDAQIKQLTAMGGKDKEIYQAKQQMADNELNNLRQTLKVKGKLSDEELAKFRELNNNKIVNQLENNKRIQKDAEDLKKKNEAERLKEKEKLDKDAENLKKQNELKEKYRLDAFKAKEKQTDEDIEFGKQLEEDQIKVDKAAQEKIDKDLKTKQDLNLKFLQSDIAYLEGKKKLTDEEKKIEQLKQDAKVKATVDTLNIVSDVLGKESAAGKALAISMALINTYQGITAGVKLGFPLAIPAVLAAAVTGFKAVKNIIATKIPNGGGGSGGGSVPSMGSMEAPIKPQAQTTTLSTQSINQIGVASSRAFVLETDVTNSQERIQRLNRAARIN